MSLGPPYNRANLVAVARGSRKPDLIIAGAHVFSAFTREWLRQDVAISAGRIAALGTFSDDLDVPRFNAPHHYLVPGFIDAHVHIESSKLSVPEFARTVMERGTTTIIADPHEIANVLGARGVHWLLDACASVALEVFVMAPSCVPASGFESSGGAISLADMESILERDHALGVGEMMNFPDVIAGRAHELAKIDVAGATHVDGHAPGVRGPQLNAYIAAGITSDHESVAYDEALEKRRLGMWTLLREASNARNLRSLLPLITRYGTDHCAFCTDDREPDTLLLEGHIDDCCRIAVEAGLSAEDALILATTNPAAAHRLSDRGAICPGMRADLQLLPDLASFQPSDVWIAGRHVVSAGRCHDDAVTATAPPRWVTDTVKIAPIHASDLRIPWHGGDARIIVTEPDQIITGACSEVPPTDASGDAVADAQRDIAKIAVIERHRATGRLGLGLVRGFGLQHGAFASTVAHDAHNLVVVGTNDADMFTCVERLRELGGGIVIAADGAVKGELALPLAGLMSDRPVREVVAAIDELHGIIRALGVSSPTPFMQLSFLALSVIPTLKLTDRGLVDVASFALVPLALDGAGAS